MSFVQGKCSNCGGILAVNTNNRFCNCLYCGKEIIVKEAIEAFKKLTITDNSVGSAVNKLIVDKSKPSGEGRRYEKAEKIQEQIVKHIASESNGNYQYYDCSNITNLKIPQDTVSINSNAFKNCRNLTEIEIPESVANIENTAFNYCPKLTTIKVDKNNKNFRDIDGVLFSKDMTEIIYYPAGKTSSVYTIQGSVTSVRKNAFRGSVNLRKIRAPGRMLAILQNEYRSKIIENTETYPKPKYWPSTPIYTSKGIKNVSNSKSKRTTPKRPLPKQKLEFVNPDAPKGKEYAVLPDGSIVSPKEYNDINRRK